MKKVNKKEAETADMVVCSPKGYFVDDVHTNCSICGLAIVHRPTAPKKPLKVCLFCAMSKVEKDGKAEFLVTEKAIEETTDFIKKEERKNEKND